MSDESPRVQELRRRVQADPASIAFAQLAEEYRRSGDAEEAVNIARAGLSHHPAYLSARVTLGRALLELGRLDDARDELTLVLNSAPDNLPAIRAMAEVHQQRGHLSDALEYYRRALRLAQFDPELESAVSRIENVVEPPAPKPATAPTPTKIEDLFDFDTLLQQLGGRPSAAEPASPVLPVAPSPVQQVELRPDESDPFSRLEQQLREQESAAEQARVAERQREAERAAREHAERLEAEREARQRQEAAAAEAARVEAERREAERRELEEQQRARALAERVEAERLEAERLEAARLAAERLEAERIEAQRQDAERAEAERLAAERLEAERREEARQEQLRLQAALAEAARRDQERRDAERREAERLAEARREQLVLAELEHWLAAIEYDRQHPSL